MTRVAILISGGGSNMVKLVDSMQSDDHQGQPCLVLSNDPAAAGLDKARQMGVPVASVDHRKFAKDRNAFEDVLHQRLEESQAEFLCLAGFMRVLTERFVSRWDGRLLNIHPSLLPLYKGLHTHQRALDAGDSEHGCTVHQVTAALDDGPILGQARVPVLADDTPTTLADRVLVQEHLLYPAVLKRVLAGDRRPLFLP